MADLINKVIVGETSDAGPALTSHQDRLYLAWKGSGNDNLNVASFSSGNILDKVILAETSDSGPALELFMNQGSSELLFLAWKGSGNDNLNAIFSHRSALNFTSKLTYGDSSDTTPALTSHHDRLFIAWKGSGNANLNVAQVPVPENVEFSS
jgi:hypothetical protein